MATYSKRGYKTPKEKEVKEPIEEVQVNEKDSSKFVFITNYYDMDSPKTSISFRKRGK